MAHHGGCLCGGLRYRVNSAPIRVTVCYCRFCQRATGSTGMIEPIFAKNDYAVAKGSETIYRQKSAGSGKWVNVHFCATCGTKVRLSFERFPDSIGVYAGTFDHPNWFECADTNTKHIFLGAAQRGTIIPPSFNCYDAHALTNDGEPIEPYRYEHHHRVE